MIVWNKFKLINNLKKKKFIDNKKFSKKINLKIKIQKNKIQESLKEHTLIKEQNIFLNQIIH